MSTEYVSPTLKGLHPVELLLRLSLGYLVLSVGYCLAGGLSRET